MLALGGGGIRGAAHTALLDVLSENKVPILGLAGSSAGALAAAVYAFGLDTRPEHVNEWLKDPELERLRRSGVLSQVTRMVDFVRRPYLAEGAKLREGYRQLFGERKLEESPIPLIIQATDFLSGELIMLRAGSVAEALAASSAIPSIFPPVPWHGRLLVDGDVAEKVPVTAAKTFRKGPIIASDISNVSPEIEPRSAMEAALQAGEASRKRLLALALVQADLVISLAPEVPIDTFDLNKSGLAYELGRKRAEAAIPMILQMVEDEISPPPSWWSRLLQPRLQANKAQNIVAQAQERK